MNNVLYGLKAKFAHFNGQRIVISNFREMKNHFFLQGTKSKLTYGTKAILCLRYITF